MCYYKLTCFQDAVNPLTEIWAGDTSLDNNLYSLLLLNSLLIVGILDIAKSLSVSSCNNSNFCISYIVKNIHASTCFVHLITSIRFRDTHISDTPSAFKTREL